MHHLRITRLYLQVARIFGYGELKFTTEDGKGLTYKGFVTPKKRPVLLDIPGNGALTGEHSQMVSVSYEHIGFTPDEEVRTAMFKSQRITFDKVSSRWTKSGVCPRCGKTAKRSETFMQTLNPFNTGPDDKPKSREMIIDELNAKGKAWKQEPTYHLSCEEEKKNAERADRKKAAKGE